MENWGCNFKNKYFSRMRLKKNMTELVFSWKNLCKNIMSKLCINCEKNYNSTIFFIILCTIFVNTTSFHNFCTFFHNLFHIWTSKINLAQCSAKGLNWKKLYLLKRKIHGFDRMVIALKYSNLVEVITFLAKIWLENTHFEHFTLVIVKICQKICQKNLSKKICQKIFQKWLDMRF